MCRTSVAPPTGAEPGPPPPTSASSTRGAVSARPGGISPSPSASTTMARSTCSATSPRFSWPSARHEHGSVLEQPRRAPPARPPPIPECRARAPAWRSPRRWRRGCRGWQARGRGRRSARPPRPGCPAERAAWWSRPARRSGCGSGWRGPWGTSRSGSGSCPLAARAPRWEQPPSRWPAAGSPVMSDITPITSPRRSFDASRPSANTERVRSSGSSGRATSAYARPSTRTNMLLPGSPSRQITAPVGNSWKRIEVAAVRSSSGPSPSNSGTPSSAELGTVTPSREATVRMPAADPRNVRSVAAQDQRAVEAAEAARQHERRAQLGLARRAGDEAQVAALRAARRG